MSLKVNLETRDKILIYIQDLGGAVFLLPIINSIFMNLKYSKNLLIIVHPISNRIIDSLPNMDFINVNEYPIAEFQWDLIFNKFRIKSVICTLSENSFDSSNANLITQARKECIPTIGYMDHWKGFHRLMSSDKTENYCPNWLGLIDESSIKNFNKLGIVNPKIKIVGHTVLEKIKKTSIKKNNSIIKILLVSQPNIFDGSFKSIFDIKINNDRLIDLISLVTKACPNCAVSFRPHPKDLGSIKLPNEINIDASDKNTLFSNYNNFIGISSMLLFEAHLSGRKAFSIEFEELSNFSNDALPLDYSIKIKEKSDLSLITVSNVDSPKVDNNVFAKSTEKSMDFLYQFLKCNYVS